MKFIKNVKNNIPFLINLINKQNLNEYIKKVVNFSLKLTNILMTLNPGRLKIKTPKE